MDLILVLLKKTACSSPLLYFIHSRVDWKCTNWISLAWKWPQDVLQDCLKCTPTVNEPSVHRSRLELGWCKSPWQLVCEWWSLPTPVSLQISSLGSLSNVDFFSCAGGGNGWTVRLFCYSLFHMCPGIWQSGSYSQQSGSSSPASISSCGPQAVPCTELARVIAQIYNSIRQIDKAAVTTAD